MSSRFYDYIVEVQGNTFYAANSLLGSNSNAFAEIVSVSGNNLKVKVSNVAHFFEIGETVFSNSTTITVFSNSQSYTSTGVVVDGNTYLIDGDVNTFALPRTAEFKSEIQVYANNILVPQSYYEFPSQTLDGAGIDFNNITISTFNTANDDVISTEAVFPSADVTSLEIKVERGLPESFYFVAANTPDTQSIIESDIVSNIYPSNYIATKNAFEQEPVVVLYDIYYPGEWYPPNDSGNPVKSGAGYPWPHPFPLRYIQVFGDDLEIPDYSITYEGKKYEAFPVSSSGTSLSSDGTLGEITLTLDNTGYFFSSLVENPQIVGNNTTGGATATVNGELVTNIDYRTDPTHASYDANVASTRGGINVAFDYASTVALGDIWEPIIHDSRDILGAVVEIRTIYASQLEHWPEFAIVRSLVSNVITVSDTSMYRVGDTVVGNTNPAQGTIVAISNNDITVSQSGITGLADGHKLLIENSNYDPYAYMEHKLFVTKMISYNDTSITFNLTERNSNLVDELPNRKFYKNTCPWKYKGVYCKYPSSGSGTIANTYPEVSANGMFTVTNVSTSDPALDRCAKTVAACKLRNNIQNFGGFPGTNEKL